MPAQAQRNSPSRSTVRAHDDHYAVRPSDEMRVDSSAPSYRALPAVTTPPAGPVSDDPRVAELLRLRSKVYKLTTAGLKAEALVQATAAVALAEAIYGADDMRLVDPMLYAATLNAYLGHYAEAGPLYQRALAICDKQAGPESSDTASACLRLGWYYADMATYAQAEPLFARALTIRQKLYGNHCEAVAECLNSQAVLYDNTGHYAKAEKAYLEALAIRRSVLGPNHALTASVLNNLGILYWVTGEWAKAEASFRDALRIRESQARPMPGPTATVLNNLAMLDCDMGDYAQARTLFLRVLRIREKVYGSEHPLTMTSVHNLAMLYVDLNQADKAEPLLERVLEVRRKTMGDNSPDTARTMQLLAQVCDLKNDPERAAELYQKAYLARRETLGPEHHETAESLASLARADHAAGRFAEAERLFRDVLDVQEKTLGPDHPQTLATLENLSFLLLEQNRKEEATVVVQQLLEGREKRLDGLFSFASERQRAEFQKTLNLMAAPAALGDGALIARTLLRSKGIVLDSLLEDRLRAEASKDPKVRELMDQLRLVSRKRLQTEWQASSNPPAPDAIVVTPAPAVSAPVEKPANLLPFVAAKPAPVTLGSLVAQRWLTTSTTTPILLARGPAIVKPVTGKTGKDQKPTSAAPVLVIDKEAAGNEERAQLEQQENDLQSALARKVARSAGARRALQVTADQVKAVLEPDSALVEFSRYSHHLGRRKFEARYGALIIAHEGEPAWVDLGSAADIEEMVRNCQSMVRRRTKSMSLNTVLRRLYDQLWAPLEGKLPPGTKSVVISPDGDLNFVSFATLLRPDDQFLAQVATIEYVAAGRDLLLRPSTAPGSSEMVVVADPDFNVKGKRAPIVTPPGLLSTVTRGFNGPRLMPLPGTEKEAEVLLREAPAWGLEAHSYLHAEASEATLYAINAPRVLHLATHGLFVEADDDAAGAGGDGASEPGSPSRGASRVAEESTKARWQMRAASASAAANGSATAGMNAPGVHGITLRNPMYRSMLALAGAQTTFDAWSRGEIPPTDNDGVLTAQEVGSLNLRGTWLVVLSACDTGNGEARAGEGVMGLRRGFIQAGARNLVMTLWPVADEETVALMQAFYERALRTGNAASALAAVQAEALVRIRKEQGLTQAVRVAGPFLLTFQGLPGEGALTAAAHEVTTVVR